MDGNSFIVVYKQKNILKVAAMRNVLYLCRTKYKSIKIQTDMKKTFLLFAMAALPLLGFSQAEVTPEAISEDSVATSEVCVAATSDAYIYNIVTFSGNIHKKGFKAKMDNGRKIKRIKDANGKRLRFRTPAAALTYLASEGWELYQDGVSVEGGGNKSHTTTYWVIRKRCTQEELEQALAIGVRR